MKNCSFCALKLGSSIFRKIYVITNVGFFSERCEGICGFVRGLTIIIRTFPNLAISALIDMSLEWSNKWHEMACRLELIMGFYGNDGWIK